MSRTLAACPEHRKETLSLCRSGRAGRRGTTGAGWQGTKGFVGGTTDATTGLTHLGARDYDPTTVRFISVDPVRRRCGVRAGRGGRGPSASRPHRLDWRAG
jgi:RHS repeat-associated protein